MTRSPLSLARAHVPSLAALVIATGMAGCGSGGDQATGPGGNTGTGTKTGAKSPKEAQVPVGSVIRNFRAQVSSSGARLTATLGKPAPGLSLNVKKLSTAKSGKPTDAGAVEFGRRPQGPLSLNWNLAVAGRKLAPGRYRLVLRGGKGTGRSKPVTITVP